MIQSLCLAALFLTAAVASAQSRSGTRPLFFPAEKNNLQILPQRFEYNLLNDSQLRVGDVLIDSKKLTFSLDPEAHNGSHKATFSWPLGIINEGELAIKSNSGIAAFSVKVDRRKLQSQAAAQGDEDNPTRNDIATFTTDIPAATFEDMKYFPFMEFCIFREAQGTRLYLCSEKLSLQKQGDSWSLRPRVTGDKKEAQININGKVVGNQGIVYLNNFDESVAFTAEMASGAFLEIETRKKAVDFKDVTESEDGQRMTLSAAGTEPVDPKRIRRLTETEWQITLKKERPKVYLKGDGDIPLRQEFNVTGPLPKAKFRPQLSSSASPRTYSSSVSLQVTGAANTVLSAAGESHSSLESRGGNTSTWNIEDLPSGTSTRHYLKVSGGGQDMTAAYDIFRGLPWVFEVGARYSAPSGLVHGDLKLQWWIENFLGVHSEATRFHWGLNVERGQHFTESDDYPKVDFTTVELLWRAQEGLHFVDESWGLSLPFQMIQGDGVSITAYGLGVFWLTTPPADWMKKLMNWSEFKLNYLAASSGDTLKLSNAYQLSAKGYLKRSETFYWSYGLSLSGYKYDPAAPKEDPQLGLHGGAVFKF